MTTLSLSLPRRVEHSYLALPRMQFVTATLGQTSMNDTKSGGGLILEAMEAVANGTKYPDFKGNVAAVYTHPLEHTPV